MMILGDYSIRPIEDKDLKMLLEWRNSERIHVMMLTDHIITWEEHQKWFRQVERYNPKRNFIFEYKGEPIGYIGYSNYDEIAKKCSPGVYLGNYDVAPIEAGLYLMYMTVWYAFEELHMDRVETFIFKQNKKAIKINSFVGYKIDTSKSTFFSKNGQNQEVLFLVLTKDDWIVKKKELSTII